MNDKKWCVLGTDNRSIYIRDMYKKENKKMSSYEDADVIVCPIPFSRDNIKITGENITCNELFCFLSNTKKRLYTGSISNILKDELLEKKIEFFDMIKDESISVLNAIPTSEGAIFSAIDMTDFTLFGSNILILGYGNIGKVLSKMLKGIGANVYCEARRKKDIAFIKAMGYNSVELDDLDKYLPNIQVIFNTIPSLILDEKRLKLLDKNCCIIDLASTPGGTDFIKAKELGINTLWYLGIPSKIAPYTAAQYLKEYIDKNENMKG